MRIMPYKNQEQVIQGVVLTFSVAGQRTLVEKLIASMQEFAADMVEGSPNPTAALDSDFGVVAANGAFCELFKVTGDSCSGRTVFSVTAGRIEEKELKELFQSKFGRKDRTINGTVRFKGDGAVQSLAVGLRKIEAIDKRLPSILLSMKPAG